MLKRIVVVTATVAFSSVVAAQVGTTVKEGTKAAVEKSEQIGDSAKAAVESQPDRSIDKTKARVHKAKAHHHAKLAKEAAKDIPK